MVEEPILIAGLGISGLEAAQLALEHYSTVSVIDTFDSPSLKKRSELLSGKGAKVILGAKLDKLALPEKPKVIVISPGIDPRGDFGKFLYSFGCPVISELEFASKFITSPMIGITGTNGKTTTVELITHCLTQMGQKAVAAGNIGLALCKIAREKEKYDFIVVEVSSFQLEAIEKIKFKAAALLNISSDHIDRYDSFEDYGKTKLKILKHSENSTINTSLQNAPWNISNENYCTFSSNEKADISFNDNKIMINGQSFDFASHPLNGIHNAENLMTTLSVLNHCCFEFQKVYESSLNFKTAPHRMQHFLSHQGIEFINDSKSTNPHALLMALNSLGLTDKRNILLIAGGRDKKMDFKIVNTALCSYTKRVYLYGECRAGLKEVWEDETSCIICDDFSDAVQKSLQDVKKGEILLLSPGCSSLDSFRNYEDRGNFFIKAVQEWTKNER